MHVPEADKALTDFKQCVAAHRAAQPSETRLPPSAPPSQEERDECWHLVIIGMGHLLAKGLGGQ